MRANWVHEEMPWVAPTRGLSLTETTWPHQVLNDMISVGMMPSDNYLLPSPPAVRAGRRPQGQQITSNCQFPLCPSTAFSGLPPHKCDPTSNKHTKWVSFVFLCFICEKCRFRCVFLRFGTERDTVSKKTIGNMLCCWWC